MLERRLFPAPTRTEGWQLSRFDGGTSAPEDAQSCAAGWANLQATVLHAAPNLQSLMLPLLPSPAAAAAAAPTDPAPASPLSIITPPPTVTAAGWSGGGCANRQDAARHEAPNLHVLTVDAGLPVIKGAVCVAAAGMAGAACVMQTEATGACAVVPVAIICSC
jgi:hypothetical protein